MSPKLFLCFATIASIIGTTVFAEDNSLSCYSCIHNEYGPDQRYDPDCVSGKTTKTTTVSKKATQLGLYKEDVVSGGATQNKVKGAENNEAAVEESPSQPLNYYCVTYGRLSKKGKKKTVDRAKISTSDDFKSECYTPKMSSDADTYWCLCTANNCNNKPFGEEGTGEAFKIDQSIGTRPCPLSLGLVLGVVASFRRLADM